MATIRINNQDVEVTEEFKQFYEQAEKEEALATRRYYDHNQSLEQSLERGHDFESSNDGDILELERIESEILHESIESLNERDRSIIEDIFFNNKTKGEVAKRLGCTNGNLTQHLRVIYKKLEKLIEEKLKNRVFRRY